MADETPRVEAPPHPGRWRHLRIRPSFLAALGLVLFFVWWRMLAMPGSSYRGALAAPGPRMKQVEAELRRDVEHLAGTIGARSLGAAPQGLARAADWIAGELEQVGYAVARLPYRAGEAWVENLEARRPGGSLAEEIVIVGAHYDGFGHSPAANDNASGVAASLALARFCADARPARSLRFVFFANEEPPWFRSQAMGSRVYARDCRERGERIACMWSLETLGCYDPRPGSQRYPVRALALYYPDRADFVAFVGNLASRALVRRTVSLFRQHAAFPSEGAALPSWVPGVAWSDHASFWREGYPALLITDTALFRDPRYHTTEDLPSALDYPSLARVVLGLEAVLAQLVAE